MAGRLVLEARFESRDSGRGFPFGEVGAGGAPMAVAALKDRPRYRLGVLGLGNRSRALIRAAIRSGRFEIALVSDAWDRRNEEVGPGAAEVPDAPYMRDWRQLVSSGLLDAVVIAVPNDRHRELTLAALDAGLHVVCEKPIASSLEETRAVLAAAEASTRVFQVGMELRFAPAVQDLRGRVADGTLPRPRLVWAQEFRPPFREGIDHWRVDPARSGGTLLEKNCHHFDVFCAVLAARPVAVAGIASAAGGAMLKHAVVSVEFVGGAVGSLAVSMTQGEHRLRMGALGDGWSYEYDSPREVSTIRRAGGVTEHEWRTDVRGLDSGGWDHPGEVEQFEAFAARIDGHEDPATQFPPPLWGHLLAFAAERSARERRIVQITEDGELK